MLFHWPLVNRGRDWRPARIVGMYHVCAYFQVYAPISQYALEAQMHLKTCVYSIN